MQKDLFFRSLSQGWKSIPARDGLAVSREKDEFYHKQRESPFPPPLTSNSDIKQADLTVAAGFCSESFWCPCFLWTEQWTVSLLFLLCFQAPSFYTEVRKGLNANADIIPGKARAGTAPPSSHAFSSSQPSAVLQKLWLPSASASLSCKDWGSLQN